VVQLTAYAELVVHIEPGEPSLSACVHYAPVILTELLPPKDDGLALVVRIVVEVVAAQVVITTVLGGLVVADSPVQGAS
jgi:hypothetical protein